MRCPKCGYNSFDHLDNCKKCGKDLTEHKSRFNIHSVLLSELLHENIPAPAAETVAVPAEAAIAETAIDNIAGGTDVAEADDFGFDFMGDSEEEESLAFDELFEEVPDEDEVEETLPAPENGQDTAEPLPLDEELAAEKPRSPAPADSADDFSFDASEPQDFGSGPAEDFGFDDDPDADIFAETEEDFSIDGSGFEETDDDKS